MIHGFNKFMWVMTLAAGFTDAAGGAEPPASLPEIRQGTDLRALVWNPQTDPVAAADFMHLFRAEPIAEATAARMRGKSYAEGCPVALSDLRYLILPHFDGQGCIRIGEMVCNRSIADDLVAAFRELFEQAYPIERMELIDNYGGDDEASMAANNTSCFNYRRIAGSRKLSRHALGLAVDINPRYNPYVRTTGGRRIVTPAGSEPYADRTRTDIPYKITIRDAAYKVMRRHGFRWGGSWRTRKDYQHFQK